MLNAERRMPKECGSAKTDVHHSRAPWWRRKSAGHAARGAVSEREANEAKDTKDTEREKSFDGINGFTGIGG